jgi:hypothetical protein
LVAADILKSLFNVPKNSGLVVVSALETPAKKQPVDPIIGMSPLGHVDGDMPAPGLCPKPQLFGTTPGVQAKDCGKQVDWPETSIRFGDEGGNDIPGRSRIFPDSLGDLEEMTEYLEQHV